MKLVVISDLQGQFDKLDPRSLPPADMLICAGDMTNMGTFQELVALNKWLGRAQYKYKLAVAGNHDIGLARGFNGHTIFTEATYLEDELVEIEGLKIFGTPANSCGPYARHWVFCDDDYVRRICETMPDNIDILISHGPPKGILDRTAYGQNVGSHDLLKGSMRIQPRLHCVGHIHENYGHTKIGSTLYVNAALCDERNRLFRQDGSLKHEPIVIDTNTMQVM